MKNFNRLFFLTTALLLGVSIQGFSQSLKWFSFQYGNILLQVKSGISELWLAIIIILIGIGLGLNKERKKMIQQFEGEKPTIQNAIPSVSDWLGRFLTVMIPVVGLIALIVWAVDDKDKIRKSWASAFLVFTILLIVFFYFLGGLFVERLMDRMGRY